jgi:hypothetical protein
MKPIRRCDPESTEISSYPYNQFILLQFLTFECCILVLIYLILYDAVNRNKIPIH